jgi:hypothetical protein
MTKYSKKDKKKKLKKKIASDDEEELEIEPVKVKKLKSHSKNKKPDSDVEPEDPEEKTEKKTKKSKKTESSNKDIEPLFSVPHFVTFLGRPKQGKSHCMRWLLSQALSKKVFKFGIVFTNTKTNGDYDFIDDKYVIQGYDENILQTYLDFLEDTKKNDDEDKEEDDEEPKKKEKTQKGTS